MCGRSERRVMRLTKGPRGPLALCRSARGRAAVRGVTKTHRAQGALLQVRLSQLARGGIVTHTSGGTARMRRIASLFLSCCIAASAHAAEVHLLTAARIHTSDP